MLATRSLDADNVIMDPPHMPPPSTLTPNFKKHNNPIAVHCLEAEAEVVRAEHTLRALGGGRDHDGDRSLSTDGRIQYGGERQGRGVGRGAGRGKGRDGSSCVTVILKRQGLASSVMTKAILLKFAQVNLRAKLSQHTSATHRLRPKHVFVLCLKNSPRLTGGYSVTNGMTTPEACVLTDVSFNSDSERKSSGLVALQCAFPQLQHDGIAVRQYPTASGRVRGWWH